MPQIIVTTQEELKTIIRDELSSLLASKGLINSQPQTDAIGLDDAVIYLTEQGYPTSKGKFYKLTSTNQIPYNKYGNRLVFSRTELLA